MKLGSIQFLRAIAATMVVYAHSIDLTTQFGKSYQQSFYYLSEIGCIGVDLFFVISGFIITYVAGQYIGAQQGLQFLQKRFFRINPIYYIASLLFFGMQFIYVWTTNNPNSFLLKLNIIPGFVDTLWVLPTADRFSHFKPYLIIGWTLAFEWLFYLLFFITIVTKVHRKILSLTSMIGLLVLTGWLTKPTDLRLAFATNAIMLEFLLGVIICLVHLHSKKVPTWASIGLLLVGGGWYIGQVFYNYGQIAGIRSILNGTLSLQRFLLWGLPSGCIAAGCIFLEKNMLLNRIWNNRIFHLVGDSSYSIYLVHLTIFTLLNILYKNINTLLLPDLSIFVQLAIAITAGVVFYLNVEKPLLKWLHRSSKRTPPLGTTPPQPQSA